MQIFVTGIGVISAIGINVTENLHSIQAGITGINKSTESDIMLGEVKLTNETIINELHLSREDFSRTSLLALIAAKEAWGENVQNDHIRTGFISGTCVGGLDRMEKYYFETQNVGISGNDPRMIHDNGGTTERVVKELGISGYIGTVSTACSSGANAILQGARLIESGILDRVVVGGSDPITQYNIKGFSSLMIYDTELCKPFDAFRKGLNLGEGAAFLILENALSLSKTGNPALCILSGWNNSSDAFHQTASSTTGHGATLAMQRALSKANISAERISYINAHGTGTENNDLSESVALQNIFGDNIPPFSSTKGFTGHTLGAAGAIEAVYCVQSLIADAILPNIHFSTAMPETGLVPETVFKSNANIDSALSNSFGFGGNCTCLIFSKAG